ncbi:Protein of unknown function (DUF2924) [Burkholderia sp. Ch1-1]|uniref:DUF2924 domain-containing protein n=1 Tax=Paraburkholderia phytofirmans OLGA172 TaxID=1417228 RepID=A0A167VQD7_9BURK|nr:DUF2924 domain-containing protein [Paraburkholderia phytofirmans]ANB71147.1 hypothetical protein AYM40_01320 [Paraburkholderia phytofirmans OLGA172]EIF28727.1 Protein of unknown function (DUF2924) [Burkholderia sp. Ch1-1]
MATINVDFDVFKALTNLRMSEEQNENDVLRKLLGLPAVASQLSSDEPAWVWKGVSFPAGTKLRATFKGKEYMGEVHNGAFLLDGVEYTSPSAAAQSVTQSPVNGWTFWQCLRPGDTQWIGINTLRR